MPYSFQTIVVPDATDGTWLGGINNAGEVTGYDAGFGSDHYPHAFTYANGAFSPLSVNQSTGYGINNAGQVVGSTGTPPIGVFGYVWSPDGSVQTIDSIPSSFRTETFIDKAYGINDSGEVVGADFQHGGFIWQNGTISLFQAPGANNTEAHGVNNAGVIVGTADNRGMVDIGGQFSSLEVPSAAITDPMAINNGDVIVGSYNDGAHWHGFIDTGGQLSFINAPGAVDTWVTGINDTGEISGYFDSGDTSKTTGFIATDPPADSAETIVREDYIAGFARDADQGGLNWWSSLVRAGMTSAQLANDLAGSAEFQVDHGPQSNADYVDSIYVNALGRHAEPAGQTAWVNIMQAGASRGDVMAAISQSSEGQQHFAALHG